MSKNRTSRFMPVIVAVSIVTGILIGTFYANHFSGNKLGIINTSSNKLNALLRIIDDQYVDTVNMGELVEDAMPQILGELDPHSSYIPAKDLEAVNSDLKRKFQRNRYPVYHPARYHPCKQCHPRRTIRKSGSDGRRPHHRSG